MSGEGTRSSADQTHDQTGGRVQPAHLSQFLPTLSAILLRNNVNDGRRKLTPESLPPLGMPLPVRYVSTPQLQPQKPHQSEDRSQVRRTVRGCHRQEEKKTEVKTEVTTERDTQVRLVRLPVSQCTTQQHSQEPEVKIEIDVAEEPPLAWCMTQQQPQSVERSQARQTVTDGCDRMEEEEWTVKTEVKTERDTQEPLLVRLPVSQCMTEQHSQEPEVKTEVKIEIDVAEKPPLAWCMAQQHSHGVLKYLLRQKRAYKHAFKDEEPEERTSRPKLTSFKALVQKHTNAGSLDAFRDSEKHRLQSYRSSLCEEKKQRNRELQRARQAKHRDKKRREKEASCSTRVAQERAKTEHRDKKRREKEASCSTRVAQERAKTDDQERKQAHREKMRLWRARQTPEKKAYHNMKRMERYNKQNQSPKPVAEDQSINMKLI
ncbi:caldesmon-like isoform X2 [Littorina saxatilis]|uniref:caldesmon-like isoform X2 n=1 Tax=Littorina saxatilis TaxID=31220 RepID=UPI0038B69EC9